ncbi:MAG: hypothetical protein ABSF00_07325 [Candidatus Bathyarchaeia archaeon]|jgi:hypothetical protein
MTAKTPLERVQESDRLLERIMLQVPGFRGYKVREERREADRIVRDYVYRALKGARDDLMGCFQLLSNAGTPELMEPTNQLIAKLDRVAEKVNRASYGYSGFFDSVRVEAPQLDQMVAYDTQMMESVRKLADSISNFKMQLSQGKFEDTRNVESGLDTSILQLEATFDKRKQTIEGVTV